MIGWNEDQNDASRSETERGPKTQARFRLMEQHDAVHHGQSHNLEEPAVPVRWTGVVLCIGRMRSSGAANTQGNDERNEQGQHPARFILLATNHIRACATKHVDQSLS